MKSEGRLNTLENLIRHKTLYWKLRDLLKKNMGKIVFRMRLAAWIWRKFIDLWKSMMKLKIFTLILWRFMRIIIFRMIMFMRAYAIIWLFFIRSLEDLKRRLNYRKEVWKYWKKLGKIQFSMRLHWVILYSLIWKWKILKKLKNIYKNR